MRMGADAVPPLIEALQNQFEPARHLPADPRPDPFRLSRRLAKALQTTHPIIRAG